MSWRLMRDYKLSSSLSAQGRAVFQAYNLALSANSYDKLILYGKGTVLSTPTLTRVM